MSIKITVSIPPEYDANEVSAYLLECLREELGEIGTEGEDFEIVGPVRA